MDKKLIYQGSVKNVYELQDELLFEYSDRYSLFDWGEMPDLLENKGICLANMAAFFFKLLKQNGIKSHFIGLVDENGQATKSHHTRWIRVQKVQVHKPEVINNNLSYHLYQSKPSHCLVPLEVIFRFGVGKGSSLISRVKEKPELIREWGLTSIKEGDVYDYPLIDFSTKLENRDRYLTHHEARILAGMSEREFEELKRLTKKVALILKNIINEMELELWDGKLEWAYTEGIERGFMLVDSIGLDELRIEKKGQMLSKEFLRNFYRRTDWYNKLQELKHSDVDFKKNLKIEPPHLPTAIKKEAEHIYMSFTNELSGMVDGKPIFGENV